MTQRTEEELRYMLEGLKLCHGARCGCRISRKDGHHTIKCKEDRAQIEGAYHLLIWILGENPAYDEIAQSLMDLGSKLQHGCWVQSTNK